jgi:hypothetical protein
MLPVYPCVCWVFCLSYLSDNISDALFVTLRLEGVWYKQFTEGRVISLQKQLLHWRSWT